MKTGIHPDYRDVVFHDTSVDEYFVIGSTLKTSETIDWKDGNTYPYYPIDTSSSSHPFYTGKQQIAQAEGRVANFNRRFGHLSKKIGYYSFSSSQYFEDGLREIFSKV